MKKIIEVSTSDLKVGSGDCLLQSAGIGSCLVITFYDPVKKIGGMAHPMLPAALSLKDTNINTKECKNFSIVSPEISHNFANNLRYVEDAIDALIEQLLKLGAEKSRLEAKIVGGANMFCVFDEDPESIGIQNIKAAKQKLNKEGIRITANDTGGNIGRFVVFDLGTGMIEVKVKV